MPPAASHAIHNADSKDAAQAGGSVLRDLLSLTKPRLSGLVLFTAGGGLWLAPVAVDAVTAMAAVLGTTMVVGGANALNCYMERETDQLMGRTSSRPLPAGRLSPQVGLAFGVALSLISVPLLTLLTTPLAGLLAAIALITYVVVYTPMKRRSSVSTLVGAVPGALPPLIGWTAATGALDPGGLALFALLFLWQIPHSLAIGIYRGPEYAKAGLQVFPNEHGLPAARRQALLYTTPLVAVPLLLVQLGIGGWATLIAGATLGCWFFALALQGFRHEGEARWARRFFFASLIYLTGLFGALGLDSLWLALV
jgi:protoheme IX farnesyltransferase